MSNIEINRPSSQELSIPQNIINVLRGEVSSPVETISQKPGFEGQEVKVRLALRGPGMFGLEDMKDNREWAGIINHVLLSARYAVYFAQKLQEKGVNIDPQIVLEAMIVSHPGRRQSDEARWYPKAVEELLGAEEAQRRQSISNETLGLQLIQDKVSSDVFILVAALAHNIEGFDVPEEVFERPEFLVAIYADHRTSQKYEPLATRMGDFLLGNFFEKGTVTDEKKQEVYEKMEELIEQQKKFILGEEGTKEVTLEEADEIATDLGAKEQSARLSRKDLIKLILQDAATEAWLIQNGIDPNMINDEIVPMPHWEDGFRTDYIKAAEEEIKAKLEKINQISDGNDRQAKLNREFPPNTWWGSYVRKLYFPQE